jgi:hypothetical protein
MFIQVTVTTEVIEKNGDLRPSGMAEDKRLIIEFDIRKRNYHKLLNLKRKVKISWTGREHFLHRSLGSVCQSHQGCLPGSQHSMRLLPYSAKCLAQSLGRAPHSSE